MKELLLSTALQPLLLVLRINNWLHTCNAAEDPQVQCTRCRVCVLC
jgi:hypothetical protein